MKKKRFFWIFYPPFVLITSFSLIVATWYISSSLREFYYQQVSNELIVKSQLLVRQLYDKDLEYNRTEVQDLCKELGHRTNTRISVILLDGTVLADSDSDPLLMEDHSDRPEIKEAFSGSVGKSIRYSSTLDKRMMYVALPLKSGDEIIGSIRTSVSISAIDKQLYSLYFKILTFIVIFAVISAVLIFVISRRISLPLEEIKSHADKYAKGELTSKLPPSRIEEINALSDILNIMAEELDKRINTVIKQRNQLETVLSSMEEGVLAIDSNKKVITINRAAVELLNLIETDLSGRNIQEIIRKPDFHKFVEAVFASQTHHEENIILQDEKETHLKLHGSKLVYDKGGEVGALIILNNITHLEHLERIRKDFVANVSHELKTPITSIKGFVETILDGAIDDSEETKRFLSIIKKHSDRLDAIINDLLSLSYIEQEGSKEEILLSYGSLEEVLKNSIEICTPKAKRKNISIKLDCQPEITTQINSTLLEQAVTNLLDNAIKFSSKDGNIEVVVKSSDEDISIDVIDYGCGILEEHISRLTERFYRVDKSRSRKLGGTGLGLAIVKHIVELHNGRLRVKSKVGKGSQFSIIIPA